VSRRANAKLHRGIGHALGCNIAKRADVSLDETPSFRLSSKAPPHLARALFIGEACALLLPVTQASIAKRIVFATPLFVSALRFRL
jgi:hypothetical protein